MPGIFANPLWELKEYEDFHHALTEGTGTVGLTGCVDSEKVHLMSTFLGERRYQLVVTYNEQRAREIQEDYRLFCSRVYLLPPKDLIFFQADLQSNTITRERMKAIQAILEGEQAVIITTMDGLMNALAPISVIADAVIHLKEGEEVDLEQLSHQLVLNGYDRVGRAEQPGQFVIHGGIIDIFPFTGDTPVRIELWGDEIDSIRYFDALSQRSIEQIPETTIYPATELVMTDETRLRGTCLLSDELKKQTAMFKKNKQGEQARRLEAEIAPILDELKAETMLTTPDGLVSYFYKKPVHFYEYLPKDQTLIFLDEPVRLEERGNGVLAEFEESMKNRLEQGYLLPGQTGLLLSPKQVLADLNHAQTAGLGSLDNRMGSLAVADYYALNVQNMTTYRNSFEMLLEDLKRWKKERYRVVLLCPSRTRGQRLASQLVEEGLLAYCSEEENKEVQPGEIMIAYGNLHRGFLYPMLKFAVITDSDLFGVKKKKKERKQKYQGMKIQEFADLKPGDYVVHESYGLGIYRGTFKQVIDRVTKDYIKIEYGDGGNLYIPVTHLHMIQKYADASATVPKLNRLSGPEWSKTRSRVQKAVANIAKELVELYAVRQESKGYAFREDSVWQKEFEEMFPFEETQDQLKAIEDTKRDMESTRIMDRLVCGDVGYGKTEIAIRAAFKAVQDSKQVVYLVPTTILAQQIYNTFVQRMKDYPIRIEMLSRFRSPAQVHATVENLKKGLVDIVIGTHRVLSKDVIFKDLGLLIIDEEQRFGVAHKEKIKQMKKNVDVLTLTATPIPRTLHMSMIGVRDMSVLEEAPSERRPIQTYVMEMNWEMVREAINRELARDGQVYYVYNRVKDIDQVAASIAKLVPDAVVAYAHGQMNERQMEQIMMDFVNGEIDILVSTTIIETGLDIPNVNTIIIHDADRYGLAQLYQLRGRVGRSNRTAYAFILYQTGKLLKEVAEKRLQAIREYTDLGSGIKIAMRDLEIRGAGNLLGSEQHGHMEAVGYDLYCKMLNEAVRRETGELTQEESFETTIDIPINAYIPDSYIRNETEKMDIYKRIAAIETEEESMEMVDELIDRFGETPKSVMNLIESAMLRHDAHALYIRELKATKTEARFFMHPQAKLRTDQIPGFLKIYNGALRFIQGDQPYFLLQAGKGKIRERELSLGTIKQFLQDMNDLLAV